MPQVFTNGDRGHAARCLSALGVEDCLHGVIAFEDVMAAPPVRLFKLRDLLVGEEDNQDGSARERGEGGEGEEEVGVVESWSSPAGALVCCKPQVESFQRALNLVGAVPSQSVIHDTLSSRWTMTLFRISTMHPLTVCVCLNSVSCSWVVDTSQHTWQGPSSVLFDCIVKRPVSREAQRVEAMLLMADALPLPAWFSNLYLRATCEVKKLSRPSQLVCLWCASVVLMVADDVRRQRV